LKKLPVSDDAMSPPSSSALVKLTAARGAKRVPIMSMLLILIPVALQKFQRRRELLKEPIFIEIIERVKLLLLGAEEKELELTTLMITKGLLLVPLRMIELRLENADAGTSKMATLLELELGLELDEASRSMLP